MLAKKSSRTASLLYSTVTIPTVSATHQPLRLELVQTFLVVVALHGLRQHPLHEPPDASVEVHARLVTQPRACLREVGVVVPDVAETVRAADPDVDSPAVLCAQRLGSGHDGRGHAGADAEYLA